LIPEGGLQPGSNREHEFGKAKSQWAWAVALGIGERPVLTTIEMEGALKLHVREGSQEVAIFAHSVRKEDPSRMI